MAGQKQFFGLQAKLFFEKIFTISSRYSVSYVATKQSKQSSYPVWSDAFDVSIRPWQDVTVQLVVPGALHATFYNSASTAIYVAHHVPFSATVTGASQVRYRGLLKFPYSGVWSIHFKECLFSFGFARFQGANVFAASVSGGNTTINVSIVDSSQLHDIVFQCSNFLVNKSSVTFSHSQSFQSPMIQPVLYSGFDVLSKTSLGQGLWATYYGVNFLPRAAVANQVPPLMLYRPDLYNADDSSIRWTGFIQVNSTKLYTFAIRYESPSAAYLKIDDQITSTNYAPATINFLFVTVFLQNGELYDVDISISAPLYWRCSGMRDLFGLLWIERSQPESSLTAQLSTFPADSTFSALSSSTVIKNDMSQFAWTSPLETRVVRGASMARGMGYNRLNTPLLLIVNSGSVCAAKSSFASSASLSIFTAGVLSTFIFTARDQFENLAETAPIMTFWGLQSSQGSRQFGITSPVYNENALSSSSQTQPPLSSGLIAYYTANSYNSAANVWNDLSSAGNHVTEIGGVITIARPTGSAAYIQGGTSAWMRFPSAVLPPTYTLFYVARYNGPAKQRIFQGQSSNWLSGFYANRAGVAYHNCWITGQTDLHGSNWVAASDRMNSFRSNGVERTIGNSCVASVRMSINTGNSPTQTSDFAIQIILVYNRRLSDSEVISVEKWLSIFQSECISSEAVANHYLSTLIRSQVKVSFFTTLSGTIFQSLHFSFVCLLHFTREHRRVSNCCARCRWCYRRERTCVASVRLPGQFRHFNVFPVLE
jgi:hypothetical protein